MTKRPVKHLQAAFLPFIHVFLPQFLEWIVLPNQGDEATFYPHCAAHCLIMLTIWPTLWLAFVF